MTTDSEHTHRCAPGCQNETCYMCGHSHPVMAHWSSNGETRALCHADDHSCYTRHNWAVSGWTYTRPEYGTVSLDIMPDITRLVRQLKELRQIHEKSRKRIKRLLADANRCKPLIHKGGKP